ncbi:hypothetical protein ALO_20652 [Acetonema longum DSM 6540]|uniref:Uncharacterized protein n=1 Tax=Acetonema longum DSM 6540 TaxID=1009370 RepID=F7NPT3_9FIRM|nr:hypothetical protein ALO_20652 [Acetonema longum DSM 6540]
MGIRKQREKRLAAALLTACCTLSPLTAMAEETDETGSVDWSISAGRHEPQPHRVLDKNGKLITDNYYGEETPIALSAAWRTENGNQWKVDYSKLWEETAMDSIFFYEVPLCSYRKSPRTTIPALTGQWNIAAKMNSRIGRFVPIGQNITRITTQLIFPLLDGN